MLGGMLGSSRGAGWLGVMLFAAVLGLLGCKSSVSGSSEHRAKGDGPARSKLAELEPGVFFREVSVERPAGRMRVWLYAPRPRVDEPIGCVLVPPAGGNLISGMRLGRGDRAEHLPYVRAGYVVVSFDIDGPISRSMSDERALASIKAFRASEAGVANGVAALDTALRLVPTIDRKRIFVAGHSSAATLALLLAADDERIRAVAAFAPVTNVVSHLPQTARDRLEQAMPGYGDFLRDSSPIEHAAALATKPVFLFHALDDRVVSPEESARLFAAMANRNPASVRVVVQSGGHYGSMIRDGVPRAIDWFDHLATGR